MQAEEILKTDQEPVQRNTRAARVDLRGCKTLSDLDRETLEHSIRWYEHDVERKIKPY